MEILAVLVLIVLVPLAMIVLGMKLIGGAGSSLAQTRREWKDLTAESFANKFFTKHGVNAPWELYISEFQAKFGRLPKRAEIKVPRERGNDILELFDLCDRRGIY